MKKIIGLIAGVTLSVGVFAQAGKLKKADDFYQRVSYAEALPLYTDLIGSTLDSPKMQAKLADCYYQIGETAKSEEVYAKMISTSDATSNDIYNYAQSLKENGKYAESDQWMEKFHTKESNDSRGKQFSQNKSYVEKIEAQGAYFSIKHLSVNTKHADFGGYPMGNEQTFIVSNRRKSIIRRAHTWNGQSFLDIYQTDVNASGELENVDFQSRKVNKKFHEGPLCFSPDNKTVYFTRNNMSGGKNRRDEKGIQRLKLYLAEVDEKGKWINEREMELNSKDYSVGHPSISADGKTMYFTSDMPGGFGGADIYKMAINADGSFGKPENLGAKINTEGQEMFPWIDDEGVLFFASDGHLGLGGLDVFVSLPNSDGTLGKIMNAGKPINSTKDDFAMIMNSDNMTGYVSSNRTSGSGNDDIYSFQLLRPLKVNLSLKGVVTDLRSNEIVPGALVNLLDAEGNVVATTNADENGGYEFGLEPDVDYTIAALKDDYFDNSTQFSTKNLPEGTEQLEEDVSLEKDPGLALYTLILDAKTQQPMEGVSLKITDKKSGEVFADLVTSETGDYLKGLVGKKINDQLAYTIELSKEGYFPKTLAFAHTIDKPGVINVHELLEGGFSMDEVVTDLTKLIEINPINFDLNKAIIRPDAAKELDKIVTVMNDYPNMEVELGAHTDCRGSKAYNRKLSDRRAKASAAYIKSKITNPERIYGKGYGESRLLNGCECEGAVKSDCSEEEHEKNRRTEFKVISTGDDKVKVQNNSTDSFDNK